MPFEGYLVDRFGPRLLVAVGGVLVGVAWWINAGATFPIMLYMGGVVGGVGAGIVYGRSVGNALKWFPDHRGWPPASRRPRLAPALRSPSCPSPA